MKHTIIALLLGLSVVVGCGGGHLGEPYTAATAPADRGTVYIYRPHQHRRSAVNFLLTAADAEQIEAKTSTVIGYIEDSGYVPITAVGKLRIAAKQSETSVDLDVEPGKSYFIRFAGAEATIAQVDEAKANSELGDTKLQLDLWRGK